jgi:predicted Zn-dependent protease
MVQPHNTHTDVKPRFLAMPILNTVNKHTKQLLSRCLSISCVATFCVATSALFSPSVLAEYDLPDLGDTSSINVSPRQEQILGQQWMRAYRAQVATSSDPIIIDYLESLFDRLLPYSQLPRKHVDLLVADNNSLNAFAVPGGIIGIHTGLFNHAKTENQLAAVITHEMAHLSQRHYARSIELQKNMLIPTLAGLLAGLVLAANSNGDAGMAAIMTTQAAALQSRLSFSRQNEQEADRIGLQTMIDAGIDPHAAGDMFEEMMRASRFYRRPPEYLLTHPISERRVADARNRASRAPRIEQPDNPDYQIVRTRVRVNAQETPQQAIKLFKDEVEKGSENLYASRYGLALSYMNAGEFAQARDTINALIQTDPERISYLILQAEIESHAERHRQSLSHFESLLKTHPESYPVKIRYAEALMRAGSYTPCVELLNRLARTRPNDDYVWYLLAEVNGLAGDILGVHQSRAEYFILNGVYDRAATQLRLGLQKARGNAYLTALMEERLKYCEEQMSRRDF